MHSASGHMVVASDFTYGMHILPPYEEKQIIHRVCRYGTRVKDDGAYLCRYWKWCLEANISNDAMMVKTEKMP